MYRRPVFWAAIALVLLTAVVPMLLVGRVARHIATEAEQDHLVEYGHWTLRRAEQTIALATRSLDHVTIEDDGRCTPLKVSRLRQIALENRSVDGVGYLVDGRLSCTNWGAIPRPSAIGKPDTMLPAGVGLYIDDAPRLTGSQSMLLLTRGDTAVFVNRDRLVDVLTDTEMTLDITTLDGRQIARSVEGATTKPDRASISSGPSRSTIQAVVQDSRFRVSASTSSALVDRRAQREVWILIPIALAASSVLIALIVWLSMQRLSLANELKTAIQHHKFHVRYQPVIDLSTGRCSGAEALARWRGADGMDISPDIFIPLAEKVGVIEDLTGEIISLVIRDTEILLREHPHLHVAINLSAADLASGRFLERLERLRIGSSLPASQICLEVTERAFIQADAARRTLERARGAGYIIKVDDFGTGYSSLSLLASLPLDGLKIDKSFVDAIGKDAVTSTITHHISDIARSLKLTTVAEGVETPEQEAYLRTLGVDQVQGWLYAKPLSAKDFADFVANSDPP